MKTNLLKIISLTIVLLLTFALMLSLAGCKENTVPNADTLPATEGTMADTSAKDESSSNDVTDEPEVAKLDLNQDLVADIGLTFEELKTKHGEVVDYDVLNGGSYYKFENGYGFYFFYGNPTVYNGGGDQEWVYKDDGTPWYPIPDDGCVCISIDRLKAKDIFSIPFEKLNVSEVNMIDGVSANAGEFNLPGTVDSCDIMGLSYNGFPSEDMRMYIKYVDNILPESYGYIFIHSTLWEALMNETENQK